MSALGQKRTFTHFMPMSAFPPKADIVERDRHVCAKSGYPRYLCELTKSPVMKARGDDNKREAIVRSRKNRPIVENRLAQSVWLRRFTMRSLVGFSVWPLLSGFSYTPCSVVSAMPLVAMTRRQHIDIAQELG